MLGVMFSSFISTLLLVLTTDLIYLFKKHIQKTIDFEMRELGVLKC